MINNLERIFMDQSLALVAAFRSSHALQYVEVGIEGEVIELDEEDIESCKDENDEMPPLEPEQLVEPITFVSRRQYHEGNEMYNEYRNIMHYNVQIFE